MSAAESAMAFIGPDLRWDCWSHVPTTPSRRQLHKTSCKRTAGDRRPAPGHGRAGTVRGLVEDQSALATVVLPIALAIIMVTLGLSLTPADFKRVLLYPKGVAIGLFNLLLVSPVLAFGVAEAFDLEPAFAV